MKITLEIGFSFKLELPERHPVLELPEGSTVLDALRSLADTFPGIRHRLFDEQRAVRRYINVLVNGENVTFRKGFMTTLNDTDCVSIIPPLGGG